MSLILLKDREKEEIQERLNSLGVTADDLQQKIRRTIELMQCTANEETKQAAISILTDAGFDYTEVANMVKTLAEKALSNQLTTEELGDLKTRLRPYRALYDSIRNIQLDMARSMLALPDQQLDNLGFYRVMGDMGSSSCIKDKKYEGQSGQRDEITDVNYIGNAVISYLSIDIGEIATVLREARDRSGGITFP